MARRSFSLLLARRYLNPRRSMLSSFTLVSLIGVLLGVLVLVVVMAVYAGMERQVKGRLLGFTPHVLLQSQMGPMADWRQISEEVKKVPGVESASAFIADNVVLDMEPEPRSISLRGVDTSNSSLVKGIEDMLDKAEYPDSSADMGIDDRVVISSTLAKDYQIHVGDTVRLYSTRNFKQVMNAYKSVEKGPVREAYAGVWKRANDVLGNGWKEEGGKQTLAVAGVEEVYDALQGVTGENIREPERQMINALLVALENGEKDEQKQVYRYEPETRESIRTTLEDLGKTDPERMDGEILKSLKEVVLPKEAKVIGVYQASQMMLTPDVFMPLPLAQSLAGLNDAVQGISVRAVNPDESAVVANALRSTLGEGWRTLTWMQQYEDFFTLIDQQRIMMYFSLSFIVLVSAFSMMAVMFTVTIQKRREIGVMKALGAAPGQIVRVFVYQGMILGVAGAVLGVGLGRVVIHFRGQLQAVLRAVGFDPFTAQFTGFNILPAHNNLVEQGIIAVSAFILCSLAAFVPAAIAARSDAAKSLRNL